MDGNKKRRMIILSIVLVSILLVTIGISFAIFSYQREGVDNKLTLGKLEIVFTEDTSSSINLQNAYPMSDTDGLATDPYTFQVENTGTAPLSYKIDLIEDTASKASCSDCKFTDLSKIKVALKKNEETPTPRILNGDSTLYTGTIGSGVTDSYSLYIWMDETALNDQQGTHFFGKIVISAVGEGEVLPTVTPDPMPANAPELITGLIPVTWNGSNWVKADTSSEWYNYDEQMWANAVTVTSVSRSEYNSASANTVISVDDIETMWVWIPRYSYTIGNTYGVQGYGGDAPSAATPGAIDIKFIAPTTKETGSATYSGDTAENWRTPDGFTFGSQELPGIWVGKFETSATPDNDCFFYGYDCDNSYIDPFVKPNVTSWINISLSTAFTNSQKLTAEGNRYGLDTNADGHLMKSSEWGVVAYLSQSRYGKYGNTDYTGMNKEVYINNFNDSVYHQTGCSGGSPNASSSSSCQYTYSVEGSGTGASTTGTIYGVYDMSGGTYEYTMSNYNGVLEGAIGDSGFSSLPESKYYDRYTNSDSEYDYNGCDGGICYGHALGETAGWYSDDIYMVTLMGPWGFRGGGSSDGSGAGVFNFCGFKDSDSAANRSFRLVLAPGPRV